MAEVRIRDRQRQAPDGVIDVRDGVLPLRRKTTDTLARSQPGPPAIEIIVTQNNQRVWIINKADMGGDPLGYGTRARGSGRGKHKTTPRRGAVTEGIGLWPRLHQGQLDGSSRIYKKKKKRRSIPQEIPGCESSAESMRAIRQLTLAGPREPQSRQMAQTKQHSGSFIHSQYSDNGKGKSTDSPYE